MVNNQNPGASVTTKMDSKNKTQFQIFSHSIRTNQRVIVLFLVFIINLLLVSPSLMPEIIKINPDDEAKYVDSGWRLLKGNIRDLAWGPLVAVVYAPVHLFVHDSPDWFLLELWAGRFVLYIFLWWSTIYLTSILFKESLIPFIMTGLLLVFSPYLLIIQNQSDALFVGFSMLSLAKLISFYQAREMKDLGLASLFVGLGVLARIETIVLVITLSIIGLLIGRRFVSIPKILMTTVTPALLVLGLYFLASFLLMGKLNLGISGKSYDSFEMNQAILTGGDIDLARQESRRLFGTQEENRSSILRAILNNPFAYGLRFLANAKTMPTDYLFFFGKKLGAVLLVFAAWGSYILIQRRSAHVLLILLFWVLHVLVALGFLALHIIPQSSYIPLVLGAVGIEGVFGPGAKKGERITFLLLTLLILILSWIFDKPAFMFAFLMLAVVLCLLWLIELGRPTQLPAGQVSLLLLFAAGLILREPYPFPNYASLGKSSLEQAIHYLGESLASQSKVLSPSPLPPIAAKLVYQDYITIPQETASLEALWSWLKGENVKAVYLDKRQRGRNEIYDLFEVGFEPYFSLGFVTDDTNIRIFQIK